MCGTAGRLGWLSSWSTCRISSLLCRFCRSVSPFSFYFSFSFLSCSSLSFFSLFKTSNAVSAFFLSSLATAAFRCEAARALRRLLSSSACSSLSLFSCRSSASFLFCVSSAFLCLFCPCLRLRAWRASSCLPFFSSACCTCFNFWLSFAFCWASFLWFALCCEVAVTPYERSSRAGGRSSTCLCFCLEDDTETYQPHIAYNANWIQHTTIDQNTRSSSTRSQWPMLQHSH